MSSRRTIDLSGDGWRLRRDPEAAWEEDQLFLPPVDLSALPTHPPTDGWEVLSRDGLDVRVPGTVEEYWWDEVGDYRGVSWWSRVLTVPPEADQRRLVLQFEAVRVRAEVYVDGALVGYDVVGNTPFEVDLTGKVAPGTHQLAVRITDPSGNFSWEDYVADRWGEYTLPPSHGFGGITGPVALEVTDPVYVADAFIRNKPNPTEIDIVVGVRNTTRDTSTQDIHLEITNYRDPAEKLLDDTFAGVAIGPGEHKVTMGISCGGAKLWTPETPHLYVCRVTLSNGDVYETRFGFRWFSVETTKGRTSFRLNGKRIVLRTAISWGFWPGNGIFPSPELAQKQIKVAKALGLNMLSFHRAIGQPLVLDEADEYGLLFYEEPGGYTAKGGDDFCRRWAREKLLRMVKRDRNHPSLVIYNMINEETSDPTEQHKEDMRAAHMLDPTRAITFTSSWNTAEDDPKKLHMLPNSERQYISGWTDYHHATGPGVYRDEFYQHPGEYRLRTDNVAEIVFFGEEGAIAAPPRLQLINQALELHPDGWDGADYRAWHQAYVDYLDRKRLREFFPTVDSVTLTLGDIAYYYHGRMIENARMSNNVDAYAINGWECEKWENHSGVVDCSRNPKGNPRILAYYNQPLYVAVKLRTKVTHKPVRVVADFFIINEQNLRGQHTLTMWLEDAQGTQSWLADLPVTITGGTTYGELLVERIEITADVEEGIHFLRAQLRDDHGTVKAVGSDELMVVDWRSMRLPTGGAVLDTRSVVATFLEREKSVSLSKYSPTMPPLKYVVVGDTDALPRDPIPSTLFSVDGKRGLRADYFETTDFQKVASSQIEANALVRPAAGQAGEFVPGTDTRSQAFSVRWTGKLKAPESGIFRLHADADDGIRIWLGDELVLDEWSDCAWWHGKRPMLVHGRDIELSAGREYDIRIEYYRGDAHGQLALYWTTPSARAGGRKTAESLLERVERDGTTLLILAHTYNWAEVLADLGALTYHGWMHGKSHWLGSNYFVRQHPLFAGLPVNQGMNWPFQEFAEYGAKRYGLLLDDEEAVVGFVSDHQHRVGTAVGVVRHGKGRIVLSTLELVPRLVEERPACEMVRKVLCNFVAYAGANDSA